MTLQRDKFRGCLLGLAIGDCVGSPLEFKGRDSYKHLTDMQGGGPFNLKVGSFTDDHSMALCLAASLIDRQKFNPWDQMRRYQMWRDQGYMSSIGRCFDIGGTVSSALSYFRRTDDPFAGPAARNTAGNGSLMRLAPVPMFFAGRPEIVPHYCK